MTVASDLTNGILTGSPTVDTVVTGGGTEYDGVFFHNYTGGAVTLIIYLNGVATANQILNITLATLESVYVRQKLGSADTLRAMAGAATSISWFTEKDALS